MQHHNLLEKLAAALQGGADAMYAAAKTATPAGAPALPPPVQPEEPPAAPDTSALDATVAEKDKEIFQLRQQLLESKAQYEQAVAMAAIEKREQESLDAINAEKQSLAEVSKNYEAEEARHQATMYQQQADARIQMEKEKAKAAIEIANQQARAFESLSKARASEQLNMQKMQDNAKLQMQQLRSDENLKLHDQLAQAKSQEVQTRLKEQIKLEQSRNNTMPGYPVVKAAAYPKGVAPYTAVRSEIDKQVAPYRNKINEYYDLPLAVRRSMEDGTLSAEEIAQIIHDSTNGTSNIPQHILDGIARDVANVITERPDFQIDGNWLRKSIVGHALGRAGDMAHGVGSAIVSSFIDANAQGFQGKLDTAAANFNKLKAGLADVNAAKENIANTFRERNFTPQKLKSVWHTLSKQERQAVRDFAPKEYSEAVAPDNSGLYAPAASSTSTPGFSAMHNPTTEMFWGWGKHLPYANLAMRALGANIKLSPSVDLSKAYKDTKAIDSNNVSAYMNNISADSRYLHHSKIPAGTSGQRWFDNTFKRQ